MSLEALHKILCYSNLRNNSDDYFHLCLSHPYGIVYTMCPLNFLLRICKANLLSFPVFTVNVLNWAEVFSCKFQVTLRLMCVGRFVLSQSWLWGHSIPRAACGHCSLHGVSHLHQERRLFPVDLLWQLVMRAGYAIRAARMEEDHEEDECGVSLGSSPPDICYHHSIIPLPPSHFVMSICP